MVEVAEGQPGEHADEGEDGGEDVVEDRLLDCHPRLEQHCKVTWVGENCLKMLSMSRLFEVSLGTTMTKAIGESMHGAQCHLPIGKLTFFKVQSPNKGTKADVTPWC